MYYAIIRGGVTMKVLIQGGHSVYLARRGHSYRAGAVSGRAKTMTPLVDNFHSFGGS